MLREFPLVQANKAEKQGNTPALFAGLDDDVFLDDTVDRVVDLRGVSYEMARRIVGVPSRDEIAHTVSSHETKQTTEGISVDLADRALALKAIMRIYSQINQTNGAHQHPETVPDYVLQGMRRKSERVSGDIKKHLAVLSGRTAFLEAGMRPETIEWLEDGIENSLDKQYGPGNAYKREKDKFVRKVSKVPRKLGRIR